MSDTEARDPYGVTLDLFAELSARVAATQGSISDLVRPHGMTIEQWHDVSAHYANVLAMDARHEGSLSDRYAERYAMAQQALRSPPELSLETWGALELEVSVDGDAALARHGYGPADFSRFSHHFGARIASDPAAARTYREAFFARAAELKVNGTEADEGEVPRPEGLPALRENDDLLTIAELPLTEDPPTASVPNTQDLPSSVQPDRLVLPFKVIEAAAPPPSALLDLASLEHPALGATSFGAISPIAVRAMPFDPNGPATKRSSTSPSPAPASPAAPIPAPMAPPTVSETAVPSTAPVPSLNTTMPSGQVISPLAALPFASRARGDMEAELDRAADEEAPPSRALPFVSPDTQIPELSLDQYASLCAFCSVFPGRLDEGNRRFGIADEELRQRVDRVWMDRLSDRTVSKRFYDLVDHYRAWFKKNPPSPG